MIYQFLLEDANKEKASEIIEKKSTFIFGIKLPPYFDENHFNKYLK